MLEPAASRAGLPVAAAHAAGGRLRRSMMVCSRIGGVSDTMLSAGTPAAGGVAYPGRRIRAASTRPPARPCCSGDDGASRRDRRRPRQARPRPNAPSPPPAGSGGCPEPRRRARGRPRDRRGRAEVARDRARHACASPCGSPPSRAPPERARRRAGRALPDPPLPLGRLRALDRQVRGLADHAQNGGADGRTRSGGRSESSANTR